MRQSIIFLLATISMAVVSICLSLFIITRYVADPIILAAIYIVIGIYILPLFYFLVQGILFDDLSSGQRMNIWAFTEHGVVMLSSVPRAK